jgi:hypothetical protein
MDSGLNTTHRLQASTAIGCITGILAGPFTALSVGAFGILMMYVFNDKASYDPETPIALEIGVQTCILIGFSPLTGAITGLVTGLSVALVRNSLIGVFFGVVSGIAAGWLPSVLLSTMPQDFLPRSAIGSALIGIVVALLVGRTRSEKLGALGGQ